MYLWVVLTTFLAMLAAYVLPIRSDTEELVNVPIAQTKLTQMVMKQRAGQRLIKYNSYPFYGTKEGREVNFSYGEWDVSDYLPWEFVDNDDYVTAMYCVNEDTPTEMAEDCIKTSADPKIRWLVTVGPIPERWQNVNLTDDGNSSLMSAEMGAALRNMVTANEMVGYVAAGDSNKFYIDGSESKRQNENMLYIVNYQGDAYEIPEIVADDVVSSCLSAYNGLCMAYVSKY